MARSEEKVRFFGDLGDLVGVLRMPEGASADAKVPVIVCCAGMSLTKEVWLPAHAERFVAAGYATLNFDYATFGESAGEPRCRLNCPQQVRDVRAAVSFVAAHPAIDGRRVGLYGISLGAGVAVAAAGLDARVGAVVAVAGPMDLNRIWAGFDGFDAFFAKVRAAREAFVTRGEVTRIGVPRLLASDPETAELLLAEAAAYPSWRQDVTFESLWDLFEFRPEAVASQIRGASMYIYPAADALIARFELQSAYAASPTPRALVALEGARHVDVYRRDGAFEAVVGHAIGWYDQHLAARAT